MIIHKETKPMIILDESIIMDKRLNDKQFRLLATLYFLEEKSSRNGGTGISTLSDLIASPVGNDYYDDVQYLISIGYFKESDNE